MKTKTVKEDPDSGALILVDGILPTKNQGLHGKYSIQVGKGKFCDRINFHNINPPVLNEEGLIMDAYLLSVEGKFGNSYVVAQPKNIDESGVIVLFKEIEKMIIWRRCKMITGTGTAYLFEVYKDHYISFEANYEKWVIRDYKLRPG